MCACFREKSQIVSLSTFYQREFKKKKSFWRKCVKGARKGIFYPFSHPLHIFVKIIYFFKFKLIKSTLWNNLRFFPKACTHIFNKINFRLQGLQIGAFQQRYLKCKCETPYFEGELVSKTCKNWKMSSKKNFLSGLVTKLENLLVFGKNLWKFSVNGWFQKKLLTDHTSAWTLKVCYNMGHLDNFRNITSSFGKSYIEQQTISQIQPGA